MWSLAVCAVHQLHVTLATSMKAGSDCFSTTILVTSLVPQKLLETDSYVKTATLSALLVQGTPLSALLALVPTCFTKMTVLTLALKEKLSNKETLVWTVIPTASTALKKPPSALHAKKEKFFRELSAGARAIQVLQLLLSLLGSANPVKGVKSAQKKPLFALRAQKPSTFLKTSATKLAQIKLTLVETFVLSAKKPVQLAGSLPSALLVAKPE